MSTSDFTTLLYNALDGVATITLNRPDVLNAMNLKLMHELGVALTTAADDESVRVVVLTGAGKGFCSGADLGTIAGADSPTTDESGAPVAPPDPGELVGTLMQEVFNPTIERLNSMPIPTIARLNGVAAGGGLGLSLGCDFTIAAHSASLVCTFAPRLGIVPDLASSWHLPRRLGRARAFGMAMLGDRVSAQQAVDWGLIWAAVPDGELDDAVGEVAERLRRSSGQAMARTRQIMDAATGRSISEQLEAEIEDQRVLVPRNMVQAASAFLGKQEPEFER